MQLPARGEYGLEIYANEPDKEGDTFTHMCQYLCSFIEGDVDAHYGQVCEAITGGNSSHTHVQKGRKWPAYSIHRGF